MHLSNRKIAEGLGKSHQKIHNEIKCCLVDLTFTDCGLKYSVEVISKLPNMPSYKTIYNWINNYHRKIFNFKSPLKLQEIKNLFRDKKA